MTLSPILDGAGTLIGFSKIARDITEQKSLEAQLRQSQKMEGIGQLAGGIAHDFNNLLTVINSYSAMVLGELDFSNPFARKGLEQIKEAGHRAALLTRQLLLFSRQQVLEPKVLDLNEVVSNIAKLLRRLIGEDITQALCLHPALGQVKIDPGQMEQVIMNLAVNARDAMAGGGQLTIETENIELDNAYALKHMSVQPGRYVMLAVSDTGCGMDADTQAHMFEPFFTVLVARNVPDALHLAQEGSRQIHLLLTDTIMPVMNGPELAKRVRSIRPETKVLLMSGYTAKVISHTATLEPGTGFLQKPFTPQTLTQKVHELLHESSQPNSTERAA